MTIFIAEQTTSTESLTPESTLCETDVFIQTRELLGWEDFLDDRAAPPQVEFALEQSAACSVVGQFLQNNVLLLNRDILKWSGFSGWLSPAHFVSTLISSGTRVWLEGQPLVWQPISMTVSLPYAIFAPSSAPVEMAAPMAEPPNQAAVELLRSWCEEDEEEQRETWKFLKRALDEDRLSDRKLFP